MNVRPARPETDYPAIVALMNAVETLPVTVEQVHGWDRQMSPGRVYRRMVAVDAGDAVTGYCVTNHHAWAPPGEFYVWVAVDRAWRNQGTGAALYADAEAFLAEEGATTMTSEVHDDDPLSLHFATQRGFTIDRHIFQSVLDLAHFDETPFLPLIAPAVAAGLHIFSLADLPAERETWRKLYEVNAATVLDIPGGEPLMPFDEFEQWVVAAEWFRPEGQLLAAIDEAVVGMAAVQLLPARVSAYNLMTGVLRPYRGRHIALALKLAAIRYARSCGAATITTENDSFNAPMLAVNQRLGYRPLPGKYTLKKVC
jgi:GNAT superfamily N-acetyltransferase